MWRTAFVISIWLLGCRPDDPLARARHEAAEVHAAAARTAINFDPARGVIAATLAAQADPFDPAYRDLVLRANAFEALSLGTELPKDRWKRAEYESEAGERRDPEFKHVYRAVFALVTLLGGDSPTAERDLAPVMKAHADWAVGHALLGRVYEANRKPDEALAEYQKSIELEKTARAPWVRAASLMLAKGEHPKAITTLEAALGVIDSVTARMLLAEAYDRAGRGVDALAQLERAVALDPKNGPARLSYAEHLTREQRWAEAEAEYAAATRLGMEPLATRGVGLIAYAQADWDKAARSFEAVLQLAPKDTPTLFYAAEAAEQLKKPLEAAKLYERFVEAALTVPSEVDRVATARERIGRLKRK